MLAAALAGAGIGAWASSLIGASIGSRRLKEYEDAIERGEVLAMVDVPKSQVQIIEELIHMHHPEADCKGTDPTIPAFP